MRNEFRMIRPMWLAGMAAAIVPIWFSGSYFLFHDWSSSFSEDSGVFNRSLVVSVIGAVLVSIASFGAELNHGTLASLLSQPRARWEIWQTKIVVLLVALTSIAFANYLSGLGWIAAVRFTHMVTNDWRMGFVDYLWKSYQSVLPPLMAMAFVSGLWTTLLLRQTTSSIWLAFAVPLVLYEILEPLVSLWIGPDSPFEFVVALGLTALVYTPAAYFAGRWMFMRTEVKQSQSQAEPFSIFFLPSLSKPVSRWRALFVKELRLQQGVIIVAIGVLLLHMIAIALPMYLPHPSLALRNAAEAGWAIWLLLPVLVGGVAIAEERRSGTLEAALCLPVRWPAAFTVKVLMGYGLGLFFGVVMPLLVQATHFGRAQGLQNGLDYSWDLALPVLVFISAGFYASSLASSLLHALGCAVLAGFFIVPAMVWALGYHPPTWLIVSAFGCFIYLTYRNSKQPRLTPRLYWMNCLQAIAVVLGIAFVRWFWFPLHLPGQG